MSIADFLLERFDEEEHAARVCAQHYPTPWEVSDRGHSATLRADEPHFLTIAHIDQHEAQGHGLEWLSEALDHLARHAPDVVLRDIAAKRRVVELHQAWPVLAPTQPRTAEVITSADPLTLAMRVTQEIGWLTQDEYRKRFGDEPPTAPMLLALHQPYSEHPDFRPEWLT